jgi:hypothetical protein
MSTLFFPVREHGILGGIRTFSNMLPAVKQRKTNQTLQTTALRNESATDTEAMLLNGSKFGEHQECPKKGSRVIE